MLLSPIERRQHITNRIEYTGVFLAEPSMKYILYALSGLIVLVILAAGFVLLPPHIQIRQLDIEIPELDALRSLDVPEMDRPQILMFVTTAEQGDGPGTIGHVGVLVTWLNGRQLLIDTGMDRESAVAFGKPMESVLGAPPTETFGPIEEQLGDAIDDIKGIIFTHMHSDHTQGVTAVCSSMEEPATIFQTRHQAEEQNHLTIGGRRLIDSSACQRSVLGDEMIKPIDGFPGVYAISAGGHTPGSTVVAVVTASGIVLFSGDLTNAIANVRNNEGKGWLYSYLIVPENTGLLEKWRLWLKAADEADDFWVFPAHDLEHMRQSEVVSELR
jgi:glyoxylase-like metal-dependent hydrolase (beta-lactamase superfamily II)